MTTKLDEETEIPKEKKLKYPRSSWAMLATAAYTVGAWFVFNSASKALDRGTNEAELTLLLTTYVIIGVLLGGIGQLMRAAAHGAKSDGVKRIDGWGKVVGLLGWSFGLVGAVAFAMRGNEGLEWVIPVSFWNLVIPALVAMALVVRAAASRGDRFVSGWIDSRSKKRSKFRKEKNSR